MRKIDLEQERLYENQLARGSDARLRQSKYYWATQDAINRHELLVFNTINDRDVLEIGCASGFHAKEYASFSKSYVGIDISDEAISNARELNLPRAEFLCGDGHTIPTPPEQFDCVIVNSLLHHLDLETTLPEIHRVLRQDGVLLFREPLGINPVFQIYRNLTPGARTADERPFDSGDLSLLKRYFHIERCEWFGFLVILSAFLQFDFLRRALYYIDSFLSISPLKYLFWQISGAATKR